MKKLRITTSLLVSASAIAGLAMGASIALAAHPPIQLYTYEEVAAQYLGTDGVPTATNPLGTPNGAMPVMTRGDMNMKGMPYSPKQTCTGGGNLSCHTTGNTKGLKSYGQIADHAFHGAMGMNEWMDNSSTGLFVENGKQTGLNPQKPWVQNHAMSGKWCPPSLRQIPSFQKDGNGNNVNYPGTAGDSATSGSKFYNFLHGTAAYPKVDLSMWEFATVCNTCHVGGALDEHDRDGMRLSYRLILDQMAGNVNTFTSATYEQYDPTFGTDMTTANYAMWLYPQYKNNDPSQGAVIAPHGWGVKGTPNVNPATGVVYANVTTNQLMMPNVREMDCLFCHLQGYNNVMNSVMVQAGSLSTAASVGAGLFDMFPLSPTYQGYNRTNVTLGAPAPGFGNMSTVWLSIGMIAKIAPKPDQSNCLQCHATKELKDLGEMFTGFLSSAPMLYDPAHQNGPKGMRMPSYDLNTPWLPQSATSTVIDGSNFMDNMFGNGWGTMAMGPTPFNLANYGTNSSFIGGGNPGQTGPIYFMAPTTADPMGPQDQNVLKRSWYPFPRAEWFKRGDNWVDGSDVHGNMGCVACHFTGDTVGDKKNQCDPGRGFDQLSNTLDGVPPLKQRALVTGGELPNGNHDAGVQTPEKHDTRNTVKRCENCHVPTADGTYKDYFGNVIQNHGAPDPTAKHQAYGLAGIGPHGTGPGPAGAKVQMADNYQWNDWGVAIKTDGTGSYGGQGTPRFTNFTSNTLATPRDPATIGSGRQFNANGSHLDIIDCSVCHVAKKNSMAVRALDGTSGLRFPVVIGTDQTKGIMGMFEDPGTDAANAGAVDQYNQMYQALGMPQIPAGTHVIGGPLAGWKPLHMWQKLGNMDLPLSTTQLGAQRGDRTMNFRRKLTLGNPITAVMWNNTDSNVDANGDTIRGGILNNSKSQLAGYTDIFSGAPLDINNTSGYDEPIFDPWIMHDLKAGMNFAPAGFSPIPVGFGNGPYQSMYDSQFHFTGAFKYASIWSGAAIFTEPDQIAAYKAFRTSMNHAAGDTTHDWTGTKLTYFSVPFLVTHGVQPTNQYVIGKSCGDCHAPGKGFFDGGFNMVGSGIPADASYNPTAERFGDEHGHHLDQNGKPTNSLVVDNHGDFTRAAGMPGFATSSDNMMQRPLEWIPRIKANIDDLFTGFEVCNKLGQPRTVKYDANDGTYRWTTQLDAFEAMYPDKDVMYKDINGVKHTWASWNAYLLQIGAAPAASVSTIGGSDVTGVLGNTNTTPVIAPISGSGGNVTFVATNQGNPNLDYSWTFSDVALVTNPDGTDNSLKGITVTRSFTSGKTFYATLRVKNLYTGDLKTVRKYVQVKAGTPAAVSVVGTVATAAGVTTVPVTVTVPHTRLYVTWGDGTEQSFMDNTYSTQSLTHKYLTSGLHSASVKVLNGGLVVGAQAVTITTP